MKYFSTMRPVSPGTYPVPAGNEVLKIENFEGRIELPEFNLRAWGSIEYLEPLDDSEANQYELVPALPLWYCVVSSYNDRGKAAAMITDTVRAEVAPGSSFKTTARRDIYVDWYATLEDAEQAVKDALNA